MGAIEPALGGFGRGEIGDDDADDGGHFEGRERERALGDNEVAPGIVSGAITIVSRFLEKS